MGTGRIYAILWALLFTAVSAWMGSAVFTAVQSPTVIISPAAQPSRGGELEGIALRREEFVGSAFAAKHGERIHAADGRTESAVFLSTADGYEHLGCELERPLRPETLKALLCTEAGEKNGAKLIYGFDFYYAAYYHGSEDIKPGRCRVKFEGIEESQKAELISVSRDGKDCAVLLRLMLSPETVDLRFCKAELIY